MEENEELFFGKQYDLQGEMSIENCLKIFDEKQLQVEKFQIMPKDNEWARVLSDMDWIELRMDQFNETLI